LVQPLPSLLQSAQERGLIFRTQESMQKFSLLIASQLLMVACCTPALVGQISVRRVQVLDSKDAVEIEVESSDRIVPQTRVLTSPNRLVVDFPNATPGSQLRSQSVERDQVKDLRIGLFESKPPVTRIVLDLKAAQSYQVFPSGRTVIIKVMNGGMTNGAGDASAGVENFPDQPARQAGRPALVAANFTAGAEAIHVDVVAKPALDVSFRNGLLAIKANKATLAAVLMAIQQRTGADVSIAPGAEQEKVVVDLGPAPAQEVIAELLHGSKFNFLILSAANDPGKLDRVVLTPRGDAGFMPLAPMQANEGAEVDDPGPPQQMQPHPGDAREMEPRAANVPRQPPDITPSSGDDPPPEE
jgi:hypothetical protein